MANGVAHLYTRIYCATLVEHIEYNISMESIHSECVFVY